jgi:hypothetical protein
MRKTLFASLLLATTVLSPFTTFGQTDKDEWRLAVDVLKGKDKTRDKSWAFQLLSESQIYERDAFVQNVLGIAYLHGLGTTPDTTRAIVCFEEAGVLGYTPAYHNLGMLYKYAPRDRQDFRKAYDAFAAGAEAEDPSCCYDCGFMKYKGLGCKQDYAGSIDMFEKAAVFDHAPSLYMLGLCYRNGYGVEADTAIANFYLRQSADLGFPDAMEELLTEKPENHGAVNYATSDATISYPDEMPFIEPFLPLDSKVMTGSYQGLLVTYDWSGKSVISEKPLHVDMVVARDTASGLWIQGTDTLSFSASIGEEGDFRFVESEKDLFDRYSPSFTSKYRFEKVDMNYCRGYVTGQLRLYSLDEREPDRPMYVCLRKSDASGSGYGEDEFSKIVAYSDPYSDRITLKFELSESVPSVQVLIYNRMSLNVGSFKYGAMDAGVNSLTFSPNLSDGYYVIYVQAGKQKFQAVIVI